MQREFHQDGVTLIGQTPLAVGDRVRAAAAWASEACRGAGAWMRRTAPRQHVLRLAAAVLALPLIGARSSCTTSSTTGPTFLPSSRSCASSRPRSASSTTRAARCILELAREYRWVVRYPEIPVDAARGRAGRGGQELLLPLRRRLRRLAARGGEGGDALVPASRRVSAARGRAAASRSSSRRAARRSPSSSSAATSWPT